MVLSSEGTDLGSVHRVLADEDGRVTHFSVRQGSLLKAVEKLIPILWAKEIDDEVVRLAVDARTVEQLPEYRE